MKIISTDNLIIGSGPGGAVVANSLIKKKIECTIVEEGCEFESNDELLESYTSNLAEELKLKWRNGGAQFTIGKKPISFAEACCFGGGSEINSAIYQEALKDTINSWTKKYNIDNFNSEILGNYYAKVRNIINVQVENSNAGYPSELIKNIANKENWSLKELPRISKVKKSETSNSTKIFKQTMSNTLLKSSIECGLNHLTNIKITKLIKKNNKIVEAHGISTKSKLDQKITKYKFFAKNFFICCGAVQTAFLLKKSGIKKNIGNFFRLHPTLRLIVKFKNEINAHKYPLPLFAITEFLPKIRLSGSNFSLGVLSSLISEDWQNRFHLLEEWKKTMILYVMINPEGSGKIHILPFLNEPIINYDLCKNDFINLSEGLKKYISALFNNGADEIIPCIDGIKAFKNGDSLNILSENFLSKSKVNLMSIHLFGSCIPGNNEKYCSTNSYGLVNGLENTYVCDASQIPEPIGVNPQGTVMAMSLRNIEYFLNK